MSSKAVISPTPSLCWQPLTPPQDLTIKDFKQFTVRFMISDVTNLGEIWPKAGNPATRPSLLLRIRDSGDHEAWRQFVALYGPLVYRFARGRGLQDADAADVAQSVFHAISQEIRRWQYDPQRGRFRSWLLAVTRNQVGKHFERARRIARTSLCNSTDQLLNECVVDDSEANLWEHEYQLQAFRIAADRVRLDFSDSSWQAFWRTAVEGQSAGTVGQLLGMSVGAVYTARSRVLASIKAAVAEIDGDDLRFSDG
jgi:RNA polymerase sigma factor (sigma-70 family)